MKLIRDLVFVAALAFACGLTSAKADTIYFMNGWTTYSPTGIGSGVVTLDINGVPTQAYDVTLLLPAYVGETWTADVSMLPTIPTYDSTDPAAAFKYAEITWGVIDQSKATTYAQIVDDQAAVYGVLDPLTPQDPGSIAEGLKMYSEATLLGPAPGVEFIYSPQGSKTLVQEFAVPLPNDTLTPTPEPVTLSVTGLALLAMGLARLERVQQAIRLLRGV